MNTTTQDSSLSLTTTLLAPLQVTSGLLVLFLLLGLQLVEAGRVRMKNTSAVFMRGMACLTISLLTSWVCGYSFSFSPGNLILGYSSDWFGLYAVPDDASSHWVLHAAIASIPSAIIAASMSERSHLTGHLVLAMFLGVIVYPLPAHWVWNKEGWLYIKGCRDKGGVLVVHLVSGVAAMVGSLLVGPRVEKLGSKFNEVSLPGHSLPLTAMGGMLVVIGMVAKVVGMSGKPEEIGRLAVNSLIGGAGGGVLTMNLFKFTISRVKEYNTSDAKNNNHLAVANRRWSYLTAYNGFLTGMICVCGGGVNLPSWAAFLTGMVGGVVFFMLSGLLKLNKVDDPVCGVAVNISGGVVGALVAGLVHLADTRDGMVLAWQLVGVVVMSAWVSICCLLVMLPLLVCGKLRIKDNQEKLGVDFVKIEEQAYSNMINYEGLSTSGPGVKVGILEKERSPVCAFVSPTIREQQANFFASTLKVNQMHASQWSIVDSNAIAPKIVVERPSPAISLQSLNPPPPPPYSSSDTHLTESSNVAPEITINASNTSQDDSRSPLLQSSVLSSKPLSVDVHELRAALRQQKERLKATSSQLKAPSTSMLSTEEERQNLNVSTVSINSIKSDVVRQAAKTASNKENFNYLAGKQNLDNEAEDDTSDQARKGDRNTIGVMHFEDEKHDERTFAPEPRKSQMPLADIPIETTEKESGESGEKLSSNIDFEGEDVIQVGSNEPELDSSHPLGTV